MIRVLVADDQRLQRLAFRMLVEREPGMAVAGEAGDGAAAVRLTAGLRPDVVVMDARMPGMDGIEATRSIRAMAGEVAQVPILGVSAENIPEVREQCLSAGMDAMLTKPIGHEALRNTLAALARCRSASGSATLVGLSLTQKNKR